MFRIKKYNIWKYTLRYNIYDGKILKYNTKTKLQKKMHRTDRATASGIHPANQDIRINKLKYSKLFEFKIIRK